VSRAHSMKTSRRRARRGGRSSSKAPRRANREPRPGASDEEIQLVVPVEADDASPGSLWRLLARLFRRRRVPVSAPQGWTARPRLSDARHVVGYFAYFSGGVAVCTDVDACVIAGSREAMVAYVAEGHPRDMSRATVRETTFGEILWGLERGAAYGFDKESYERFYPLAVGVGLPVARADFDAHAGRSGRFFTVRIAVATCFDWE
jgi:hypothetical protein